MTFLASPAQWSCTSAKDVPRNMEVFILAGNIRRPPSDFCNAFCRIRTNSIGRWRFAFSWIMFLIILCCVRIIVTELKDDELLHSVLFWQNNFSVGVKLSKLEQWSFVLIFYASCFSNKLFVQKLVELKTIYTQHNNDIIKAGLLKSLEDLAKHWLTTTVKSDCLAFTVRTNIFRYTCVI